MVCKQCSTVIVDGGIFCPNCGARVDGKKVCPKCKKIVPENSVFCTYCGTRVAQNKPISDETEINKDLPPEDEAQAENDIKEENKVQENGEIIEPVILPVLVPVANESVPVISATVSENEEDSVAENEETLSEDDSEELSVLEPIICPQCGSTNVELISEELGKCKNCGTQIVLKKATQTNYVTNNVNIEMYNDGLEDKKDATSYYELPKEMSEEEFFIKALTNLCFSECAPEDIFETAVFKPVTLEYRQYIAGMANVEMTYFASIGYDKKVEYQEYNSSKQEFVTKTRTVTTWQPYNGTFKDTFADVASNEENELKEESVDIRKNCLKKVVEFNFANKNAQIPLVPRNNAINTLKNSIETIAEKSCYSKLPGDRNKDFRCSTKINLKQIFSIVAPQYVLPYEYEGKEYKKYAHTVKEAEILGKVPDCESTLDEVEDSIEVKKAGGLTFVTFVLLLFSIFAGIFLPVACKIIFGVIGIVLFIVQCIVQKVVENKVYEQVKERKAKRRKEGLKTFLKKKGLPMPKELEGDMQV